MARPAARDLTERELEVMHVFWADGEMTAQDARDRLAATGTDRAYTTVATLVRILHEKGFLAATNDERPFRYAPARSYEDVSGRLLGHVLDRVFRGSREQLLVRLLEPPADDAGTRSARIAARGGPAVSELPSTLGWLAAQIAAVAAVALLLDARLAKRCPAAAARLLLAALLAPPLLTAAMFCPLPNWWTWRHSAPATETAERDEPPPRAVAATTPSPSRAGPAR